MSTPTVPVTDTTADPIDPAEFVDPDAAIGDPPTDPTPDPDAGAKKALVAERTARKAAEKELAALRAAAALKDKPAEEQALELARAEGRTEAATKANARIVSAEVRAAAAGKVKVNAIKLIDTSGIGVDDDGEVDQDALQAAITELLTEYPELAVDGAKFGGGADQGAKGKAAQPAQLSQQDLNSMTAEQISEARKSGRLDKILGVKN